ncbi:anti-sigma factor antagonist [Aliidiomarina shirensis]|uniref:Anti-sigma factor antagonist n=1 Tax=Aliidiomarina shirensis TaxID=1048642 RepID=A0A432WWH2_9GAMM|nr:STAS domain-containing protein [Aliidiomarina shirensis]RUO38087.1 anti-sigma factor antagonist [Aliidiomarina shirensis]
MGLQTEYANDGKHFIIHIKGKFDFGLVQEFRQSYDGLSDRVTTVVIELRETDYIDSSALGMLLNMRKSLGAGSRNIHLINCRPEIRQILDISRFDKLFIID